MGLEYRLNDNKNGLVVTGGKNLKGKLTIPHEDSFRGKIYPVMAIGTEAFLRCSGLTSIVINNASLLEGTGVPEGVKIVKP